MKRMLLDAGCALAVAAAAPILSALTAGAMAAPISSAIAAAVPCGPSAARTLALGAAARVYSEAGSVYGCAPQRRSIRLGSATICIGTGRAGPAVAAGRLAAYALDRCGVDTGSSSVIVRRLTDGKRLFDQPAWTLTTGPESYGSVGSIVADRGGDVAWIASTSSIVAHSHRVEVAERAGSGVRELASGAGIVPGSLRLRGSTLTWRDGTVTRSAKLG